MCTIQKNKKRESCQPLFNRTTMLEFILRDKFSSLNNEMCNRRSTLPCHDLVTQEKRAEHNWQSWQVSWPGTTEQPRAHSGCCLKFSEMPIPFGNRVHGARAHECKKVAKLDMSKQLNWPSRDQRRLSSAESWPVRRSQPLAVCPSRAQGERAPSGA